jgi:hypothetical protein
VFYSPQIITFEESGLCNASIKCNDIQESPDHRVELTKGNIKQLDRLTLHEDRAYASRPTWRLDGELVFL